METLKKILAVVWDRIVVISGVIAILRILITSVLAVGEMRPAYTVDWGLVGYTAAFIIAFTAFGWELRRLLKGEEE